MVSPSITLYQSQILEDLSQWRLLKLQAIIKAYRAINLIRYKSYRPSLHYVFDLSGLYNEEPNRTCTDNRDNTYLTG